jgi:hypothetical protein
MSDEMAESGSDPSGARADAARRISADVRCFRCGYNVRGLAVTGVCPECAYPLIVTLRKRATQLRERWTSTQGASVALWGAGILFLLTLELRAMDLFGGVTSSTRHVFFCVWIALGLVGLIPFLVTGARKPVPGGLTLLVALCAYVCFMIAATHITFVAWWFSS